MTAAWKRHATTSHESCCFSCNLANVISGQDIVEDFEKWRNGGLMEQLKAAVEEVKKEGLVLRLQQSRQATTSQHVSCVQIEKTVAVPEYEDYLQI